MEQYKTQIIKTRIYINPKEGGGRAYIPKKILDLYGLKKSTTVEIEALTGELIIRPNGVSNCG